MMVKKFIKLIVFPVSTRQVFLSIILINSVIGLLLYLFLLMPQQEKYKSLNLALQQVKHQLILSQKRINQLPLLEKQILLLKNYYKHNIWSANASATIAELYTMANQSNFDTVEISSSNKQYKLTGKLSIDTLLTLLKKLNYPTNTLTINGLHFTAIANDYYQFNMELEHFSAEKINMASGGRVEPLPQFVYEKQVDEKHPIVFADKDIEDLRMIGYIKSDYQVAAFVAEKQSHIVALLHVGQYLTRQQIKVTNITPDYLEFVDMKNQNFILPMSKDIKISQNE